MTKRPLVATLLTVAALVLLLSFKTPQASGLGLTTANGGTGGNAGGQTGVVQNIGNTQSVSGATPGTKGGYTGQITGSAVQMPFGVVQVQVTFQNGKITDVQALQLPNDRGHSAQVSQYAAPQAAKRGPCRPERQRGHDLRRYLHQPGLPPVRAVGSRSGRLTGEDARLDRAARLDRGRFDPGQTSR